MPPIKQRRVPRDAPCCGSAWQLGQRLYPLQSVSDGLLRHCRPERDDTGDGPFELDVDYEEIIRNNAES